MQNSDEVFLSAIDWLQSHYKDFTFYLERDVVWTVQTELVRRFRVNDSTYVVLNDHKLLTGKRCDLVILDSEGRGKVAMEFKYEPSHARTDITAGKFPVVMWSEVEKDVERVREFVATGTVEKAVAVVIDEGGHFRKKQPPTGARWLDWRNGVSVLWTEV